MIPPNIGATMPITPCARLAIPDHRPRIDWGTISWLKAVQPINKAVAKPCKKLARIEYSGCVFGVKMVINAAAHPNTREKYATFLLPNLSAIRPAGIANKRVMAVDTDPLQPKIKALAPFMSTKYIPVNGILK